MKKERFFRSLIPVTITATFVFATTFFGCSQDYDFDNDKEYVFETLAEQTMTRAAEDTSRGILVKSGSCSVSVSKREIAEESSTTSNEQETSKDHNDPFYFLQDGYGDNMGGSSSFSGSASGSVRVTYNIYKKNKEYSLQVTSINGSNSSVHYTSRVTSSAQNHYNIHITGKDDKYEYYGCKTVIN